MFIIKLFGGLLIVISASLMGVIKASVYKNRANELRELVLILQLLETEICYMSNILRDALLNCARAKNDSRASIFFKAAAELLADREMTSAEAWDKSIRDNLKSTSLKEEDAEILAGLGGTLGTSDYEGQVKNIRFVIKQLEVQISKADADSVKYQDMYRKLGFLSGIAAVVILF